MFNTFHLGRVKSDPSQISKIKNPSRDFLIKAIELNYRVVIHLENPDEELIKIAIQKNVVVIRDLPPQPSHINLFAVRVDPRALKYIKLPTYEVQMMAVSKNGLMVGVLDDPAPDVQLKAVQNISDAITRIKNPTLEAQICALTDNYGHINNMVKPHVDAVIFAIKQSKISKRRTKIDLTNLNLSVDEWWEVVKSFPEDYKLMNLNAEQISYAILCS